MPIGVLSSYYLTISYPLLFVKDFPKSRQRLLKTEL